MKTLLRGLLLAAAMVTTAAAAPAAGPAAFPTDAALRKLLEERVDALAGGKEGVGIVVGLIAPHGRRVVAFNRGRPRFDGDTAFEIASISKVFTALLLADMVRRGEVALDDPVSRHLPGATIPARNGRAITLLDLATHTSGLPFMPEPMPALDDPAARYGPTELYGFVAHHPPAREAGTGWDYSNLGYWLLQQALASRAGMDYERLLQARILAPLGLRNTAVTLTPALKAKLAAGHNAALEPSPLVAAVPVFAAMPAAGGIVSTADDMLTFLSAAMGHERSALAPSFAAMLAARRPTQQDGVEQALGWVVLRDRGNELIVHDGGSFGYASSVAWDPGRQAGVVVLSNHVAGVGDIARHLLRPDVPLVTPAARQKEIRLDADVLDRYAGRYEAKGEGVFTLARERDFLTIEPPPDWGLPKLRLRPSSRRDFFVAELPLRVTVQVAADGSVAGLAVYPPRGQKPVEAKRISAER